MFRFNHVVQEMHARGLAAVQLATHLLQRARLADAEAGLWEAADVQWWWRTPRPSDEVDQLFWLDGDGPVAAVVRTAFRSLQCDLLRVPGAAIDLELLWARALEVLPDGGEVPVRDDDLALVELVRGADLVPGEPSAIAWLDAGERAPVAPVPDGFVLVDRTERQGAPHPMRGRNGDGVEARLRETSLYDPWLDLSVETAAGELAGFALFWLDPVTGVGLLEPMRVQDAFQRRGLGRALLTNGLDRLARRGARRLKVGYGTEIAKALYEGAGFRTTHTDTWYVAPSKS
jgi:ribosomal protein S18 acetylase RimI-like enzyme